MLNVKSCYCFAPYEKVQYSVAPCKVPDILATLGFPSVPILVYWSSVICDPSLCYSPLLIACSLPPGGCVPKPCFCLPLSASPSVLILSFSVSPQLPCLSTWLRFCRSLCGACLLHSFLGWHHHSMEWHHLWSLQLVGLWAWADIIIVWDDIMSEASDWLIESLAVIG